MGIITNDIKKKNKSRRTVSNEHRTRRANDNIKTWTQRTTNEEKKHQRQ